MRRRRYKTLKILLITVFFTASFSWLTIYGSYNCIQSAFSLDYVAEMVRDTETTGKSQIRILNSIPNTIGFAHACADRCKFSPNSNIRLLVVVKSYIGNFDQRLAIRQTWGEHSHRFIVMFMVGKQDYAQELLESEASKYRDIVQGTFQDAYDNNTLKTVMTYKWIVEFCPNVNYVLFLDDDCLLNINNLLNAIDNRNFKYKTAMYGYSYTMRTPFRDPSNKWYVSSAEYNCLFYPSYLSGAAILTDISVIKKVNTAFNFVKHFRIDDIYLGIVAMSLHIPIIHESRFSVNYINPDQMKDYFSSHEYGHRGSLINGWKELNENNKEERVKTFYRNK